MKNCYKKFSWVGCGIIGLFLSLTCCTQIDDGVGGGIIPGGQDMTMEMDTLKNGIKTYITYTDSIVGSSLSFAQIGKIKDAVFGKTTASAVTQFVYISQTDTTQFEEEYGIKPDSMWIISEMRYISGDSLKEQKFNVFRLLDDIHKDSTYYTSYDYKSNMEATPMFSFTYSGEPYSSGYDTLRLKIENQALADAFMNELISVDTTAHSSDSLFLSIFKGLVITPDDSSEEEASIYEMSLGVNANKNNFNSYIMLYGHDYKVLTPETKESDIRRLYALTSNTSYTKCTSINCIEHDYTGTMIEGNFVMDYEPDYGTPVSETYVQGFCGVTTTLEFTEEFIAELRALVPEGQRAFINQAMMYVNLKDPILDNLDIAQKRLGSYIDYATEHNILDYNYLAEAQDLTLNYGGYLNRGKGRYELDIAIHLQKLLNEGNEDNEEEEDLSEDESEDVLNRITLGMEVQNYFEEGEVVLWGTGSVSPIEIKITYTLINN